MNRQEISDEIAALKEQLNNLEKLYDSLTSPNKRWRAEEGKLYYYIGCDGTIYWNTEGGWDSDNHKYKLGNYFQTEGEAAFEAERLKVIAELKEWATPTSELNWKNAKQKKYIISLEGTCLNIDPYHNCQVSDICFTSEEIARNAIEAVGKDRIIKYYFRRGDINGSSN